MDAGGWVAAAAGVVSIIVALVGVGIRLGRVESKVAELDRDVSALVPIATEITRAVTEMHAISALITSHMAAEGHAWTVKTVSKLVERLENVKNTVDQLEKRGSPRWEGRGE
jgi:hypothetical protein